ncbi:Sulfotransferase domain-containing protein [Yoonia tamlensis]|uniref:Sulfotransferase domain-containing protein n=2 Tax=Yoonia tamlensis TaxID=390270 RepID=A0A1I6FTE4_9RHOB|nr:Sulfotransferase domain-containing protein [Yoonia tamlensis]
MRMFLMHYFVANRALTPDTAQAFAPNENSGNFYQPFLPVSAGKLPDAAFASVRPLAHRAIAQAAQSYIFVKTHHLFGTHHGTPTVSLGDSAASVYLVRNPLDVVVSYAAFRNVSYDQAIDWVTTKDRILPRIPGGSYFISGSWSQNVSTWRAQKQLPCTILRYEDLVTDPASQFRQLFGAWRLKIDSDRFDAAIAATSIGALKAAEAEHGFRERPASAKAFFRSGRTGDGYKELSKSQQERVIDACGSQMQACGYSLDSI